MSSNNQIIIRKEKEKWIVYHDLCVDNEFEFDKKYIIGKGNNMEEAVKIANDFIKENLFEYGISFVEEVR